MPSKPKRLCPSLGCPGLWDGRRCTVCNRKPTERRGSDNNRGPHREQQKKWYDSARWKKAKALFLKRPEHAWCVYCAEQGIVTPAETIDHIRPAKGQAWLFWNQHNWAASCLRCNAIKGAKE